MARPGDDRGVSALIGFLLVVGILVLSLGIWQVNFVPADNKQVEIRHYEDIIGDMQELRNAIVRIGETNQLQAVRFRLATTYPPRVIGVNAPPAQGALETSTAGTGEIVVDGINTTAVCGFDETTSRSITYEPAYNYFENADPIHYENTVVYRETADGTIVFDSGQALIRDNTINLVPMVTEFSLTGQSARTIDFQGEQTGSTDVSKALTITIPTELSADTWENELLDDQDAVTSVTANQTRASAVDIALEARSYTFQCTPAGAGTSPEANIQITADRDEINPAAPGDIRLEGERRGTGGNQHTVFLDFNNTAELDVEIQQARINFYQDESDSNKAPVKADISGPSGTVSGTLEFREDFTSLSPQITLAGNNTITTVTLEFFSVSNQEADLSEKDWFIISIVFSNDATGTYFIPVPK